MITYINEPTFKPSRIYNNFPIYSVACGLYFARARKLYLFRPIYHPCLPDNYALELRRVPVVESNGTMQLIYRQTFTAATCQTSHIYEYDVAGPCVNSITIIIDRTEYNLIAIDSIISNEIRIVQSTLFKEDIDNLPLHVNYYYKFHGIQDFFFYYNGQIDASIKERITGTPAECNVYVFEMNHPYWQTFCRQNDTSKYWPHSCQSLQLVHSAIIANYCCDWLMNVDFDEYVGEGEKICDILVSNEMTNSDGIVIVLNDTKCGGRLCRRPYDYSCDEILNGSLEVGEKLSYKFIEQTRGRSRLLRQIHSSLYEMRNKKIIEGIHLKCVSIRNGRKRYCC